MAPGSLSGSVGVSGMVSVGDLDGIGIVNPEEDSVGSSVQNRSAKKLSKAARLMGL